MRHDANAYRAVFAVPLGLGVYVLHAFPKKAKSGIKTPLKEIDLIKRRYREAKSWPNVKKKAGQSKIEFEDGSGNVFADLDLTDAGELYTRAQIGFAVYKILKARKLKQREIAGLLEIPQPEVSHLMNGHFSRFTTDTLLDFLERLDRKVTIRIEPREPGDPYREIAFAS